MITTNQPIPCLCTPDPFGVWWTSRCSRLLLPCRANSCTCKPAQPLSAELLQLFECPRKWDASVAHASFCFNRRGSGAKEGRDFLAAFAASGDLISWLAGLWIIPAHGRGPEATIRWSRTMLLRSSRSRTSIQTLMMSTSLWITSKYRLMEPGRAY